MGTQYCNEDNEVKEVNTWLQPQVASFYEKGIQKP